jgi:hypothetical protein
VGSCKPNNDLARTVLPFLDAKRKSHSRAEQIEQAN